MNSFSVRLHFFIFIILIRPIYIYIYFLVFFFSKFSYLSFNVGKNKIIARMMENENEIKNDKFKWLFVIEMIHSVPRDANEKPAISITLGL